nr:EOG090X06NK [Ilyocryptus agilis]
MAAEEADPASACATLTSFGRFTYKRTLREDLESRTVAVEGTFDVSSPAVILLEKTPFTSDEVLGVLSSDTQLLKIFHNDIYGSFLCYPEKNFNALKATVIHPATEKHIEKYSERDRYLIEETPSIYKSVTLPHIEESKFNIQWVFNILEHKKEADRIVFEDPDPEQGFILLPDLKWDCRTISNLYLTGIVKKKGIKSLRDLTVEHLPMLKNIFEKGSASITEKYGLPKSQQRIYIHYQPTYYHLHVHFTSLQFTPPGCSVERAHLLSDVIRNIELFPCYYQNIPLNFVAFEGDQLLIKYRQHIAENGTN